MANSEWERLKEALKRAPTPQAMAEAAEAFTRYRETKGRAASKPTLVNLGLKAGYPSSVSVDEIPNLLATNPAFFNLMKKVVR